MKSKLFELISWGSGLGLVACVAMTTVFAIRNYTIDGFEAGMLDWGLRDGGLLLLFLYSSILKRKYKQSCVTE